MPIDPELTDGTVVLRPVRASDAADYVRNQDEEIVRRFEWAHPASLGDIKRAMRSWSEAWASEGDERDFAITLADDGRLVGDCEVERREDGYDNVMYVVFARWRGQGIATRTVGSWLIMWHRCSLGSRSSSASIRTISLHSRSRLGWALSTTVRRNLARASSSSDWSWTPKCCRNEGLVRTSSTCS